MRQNPSVSPIFNWQDVVDAGDVSDEIMDLLEEEGPPQDSGDDVYHGRRLRWLGEPGRMLKVSWNQVHPIAGNIFDPNKAATFVAYSLAQDDKPLWYAPAASVGYPIGITEIEESLHAAARDETFDSLGTSRPYTTGDDDLDEYLRDRIDIRNDLKRRQKRGEDVEDILSLVSEAEAALAEAEASGQGDFGTITVQLRNGNHRAAMAYALGEPYLWVMVPRGDGGGILSGELE